MTATTAPVVAVNTVSTGVVTGLTVTRAGVVTKVASPNCTFTQASTSGGGSGVTLTGSFAPIAGYLSSPTLSTGGGVANGNLFLGAETPALTMGGAENTFIGDRAGGAFTGAAGANTAVGHDAGGIFGGVAPTGSYNTFIGNDTGRNVSGTANANTAVGQAALANVSGDSNTAIGESAGSTITTGSANTILGYQVGSTTLVSGQSNVLIGTNNSIDTAAAGTSNTIKIGAGSTAIISSTGTGTPSTSATTVAGTLAIAGITTDATHTDATVCEDTTTHQLYAGSGTAGICLGTSSARFKLGIVPQTDGLAELLKLKPVNFHYRPGYGDGGGREQYGFVAEDVAKVMPKLVGLDVEGKPLNLDYMALVPVLVKAVQEQQREIEALKARIR
jgi:hypothetical protein